MDPAGDTLFVLNPNAGNGKAGLMWAEIIQNHPWVRPRTIVSKSPRELKTELAEGIKEHTRRVIAVGGDGSAHHLINAVVNSGLKDQLAVGLFPAGSGSDLRRNIGMPSGLRTQEVFGWVMRSEPKKASLIKISTGDESFRVVNICSVGISAEVAKEVNSGIASSRKKYLSTAIRHLFKWQGVECIYTAGTNKPAFSSFDLLLFANGSYFGNGIPIMPDASIFSEELHVLMVKKQALIKLLLALSLVPFGLHTRIPFIQKSLLGTAEIHAKSADLLTMEADGEIYSSPYFLIQKEVNAIRLLC